MSAPGVPRFEFASKPATHFFFDHGEPLLTPPAPPAPEEYPPPDDEVQYLIDIDRIQELDPLLQARVDGQIARRVDHWNAEALRPKHYFYDFN